MKLSCEKTVSVYQLWGVEATNRVSGHVNSEEIPLARTRRIGLEFGHLLTSSAPQRVKVSHDEVVATLVQDVGEVAMATPAVARRRRRRRRSRQTYQPN